MLRISTLICVTCVAPLLIGKYPLYCYWSIETFNCRKYSEIWVEQCWRDILSIVWDLQNQTEKLNERVPITSPVTVCFIVSQQFLISRAMVHRRPLEVWKKLLHIIGRATCLHPIDMMLMPLLLGEQSVCHEGPLDYPNLHAYHKQLPSLLATNQSLPGPETPNLWSEDETEAKPGWGAHTQGKLHY